ncbi:MAG: hypothetical protein K2H26_02455, partial [Ruminococcus sp.]|nr:hypothetical protein [Ruminococcus sp.]
MKNFRKKILVVMSASIMLTGCGQVVQNMPDVPVISGHVEVTDTETDIPETDFSENKSPQTDISEESVQTTVSSKRGYIVSATRGVVTTDIRPATTTHRVTAHIAGGTTGAVNRDSGIQRGTTHIVLANPNINT